MFLERFNQLCKETNTSRYKLSKLIGISNSTMYGWDKGQQPSADTVVKIADYFEISTDYLLGRSNDLGIINTNANLTPDEEEVLLLYRQMSFQNKNQLKGFAKALVY